MYVRLAFASIGAASCAPLLLPRRQHAKASSELHWLAGFAKVIITREQVSSNFIFVVVGKTSWMSPLGLRGSGLGKQRSVGGVDSSGNGGGSGGYGGSSGLTHIERQRIIKFVESNR